MERPPETLKNDYLSKVVNGIFQVMSKEEPKVFVSALSPYPLKVILLGKRFSGKHSIASHLAQYCSLKVIEVDQVVQEAIK